MTPMMHVSFWAGFAFMLFAPTPSIAILGLGIAAPFLIRTGIRWSRPAQPPKTVPYPPGHMPPPDPPTGPLGVPTD